MKKIFRKNFKLVNFILGKTVKKLGIWYDGKLKKFISEVGEPSDESSRNHIFLIIGLVYLFIGSCIIVFKENFIIEKFFYSNNMSRIAILLTMFVCGFAMMTFWLMIINKLHYKRKGKEVNEKQCWIIVKFLFCFWIILSEVIRLINFLLRRSKQENVVKYLLESSIAMILSSVLIQFEAWMIVTFFNSLIGFSNAENIIILSIIVMYILTFYALFMGFAYLSIKSDEKTKKKIELMKNKQKDFKTILNSKIVKKQIKKRTKKKFHELRAELEYTQLYFYVFINLILLCVPIDSNDYYGQLYANQFMGLTTLAALCREVGARWDEDIQYKEMIDKKSIG